MERAKIIDILEMIKVELKEKDYHSRSICSSLTYLKNERYISISEYDFIKKFLVENKPTAINQYKRFTKNDLWENHNQPIDNSYWWVSGVSFIRIEYLNALISNLK